MNNKGSFEDLFVLVIVIFMLGLTTVIGYVMVKSVNTQIQAQDDFSTTGKTILSNASNKYVGLFDNVFLVILIGMTLGSLLLASQIDVNPIFFPASIIIYVILIVVSAGIGNSYYAVASHSTMSGYAEDFTIIPFVFNHLVSIMLGIGFLLGVVIYAKTRE